MLRLRNFRTNQETRNKFAEVLINSHDFIYPYFIVDGNSIKKEISSLKNVFHFSIDEVLKDIEHCMQLGLNKFLLFGVIEEELKDPDGKAAYAEDNLVSRTVKAIKNKFPNAIIFTDVCLCGYTSHGHCGLIEGETIDNDSTLPLLARMAYTHAKAGADFVAPSAMMDGQVEAIKEILVKNNLSTKILSYSAKFASGFYGPFREAVSSSPSFGDRKSYQMDYRTIGQSLSEVSADICEGSDWVMVKPAHTYLDVIQRVKSAYPKAILAAYQVSGEYMMIRSAAEAGYLNEEAAMLETLTAIKRAGADYIITYYAKEFIQKGL
jgi:porphobilinogen synthase